MQGNYFVENDTFDNAIKNKEKGVLKALLVGIIGSDPTFATTEYDEASLYIRMKSKELNGKALELSEAYSEQEGEFTKPRDNWDEDYYRMLLVWYRDNYANERLVNIQSVGKEVYRNKPTLGKSKRQNRIMNQNKAVKDTHSRTSNEKKETIVRATGNDERNTRLPLGERFKQNWKWTALFAGVIAAVSAIVALLSGK